VLLWAFAAIADEIPEDSFLSRADNQLVLWVEAHDTEGGEKFCSYVTQLGDVGFALRRQWAAVLGLASAGIGAALLNNLLKVVFHRGRPIFATEFITRPSWSFPSGHAMDSMAGYGFLAFLLIQQTRDDARRKAIALAAAVLILLVGFSRIYLGVHYPSDVIGGYLAGGIWLIACIAGYRFAMQRGELASA
jgi:membrane-associated phospholipid phosphatase